MNYDVPSGQGRGQRRVLIGVPLIVVDDVILTAILRDSPDLDPEPIRAATAGATPVNGSQHESVARLAVDASDTLELGSSTCHNQPIIRIRVEVEVGGRELKLDVAGGYVGSAPITRDEAEGGTSFQARIEGMSARW